MVKWYHIDLGCASAFKSHLDLALSFGVHTFDPEDTADSVHYSFAWSI